MSLQLVFAAIPYMTIDFHWENMGRCGVREGSRFSVTLVCIQRVTELLAILQPLKSTKWSLCLFLNMFNVITLLAVYSLNL